MKAFFISGIFLFISSIMFSQVLETNPENIIIEYKDGKKIIRNKNDYKKSSPDSFHYSYRSVFEKEFTIKNDSAYICSNIIGKWKFADAIRTNNEKVNYSESIYYFFKSDKSFTSITYKDTIYGIWSYSNDAKGVLRIDYKKPKSLGISEEVKKYMDSAVLKQLENITNEIFTLNNLNNQTLTFFTIGSTEQKNFTDELHLRIIKTIYNKIQ
jgi:hypothetical protein